MKPKVELQAPTRTLADRRRALKLTVSEVAERASIHAATYSRIELGSAEPPLRTITAVAQALDMSTIDTFACLGWLPPGELPTIGPYLESKYKQLPPEAIYRIEGYLSAMCELYGVSFELDPYEFTKDDKRE